MRQTSINKAKKEIWEDLQAFVGDIERWEQTIEDGNWSPTAFKKALNSIYNQIERKL